MDLTVQTRVQIEVPRGAFAGDEPLVAVERGGYVGSLHRGTIAVCDDHGIFLAVGNPRQPAFLRSAAKPFQAMPALLSGAVDQYGLTERELAVLCASHNAEPRHMEAILVVLDKAGLDESYLHCGVHPPLHEETARQRWRRGVEPSPVCNNCSGAHAGMLIACRAMGWPVDRYEDPHHPVQVLIREILAAFAGMQEEVRYAIDNCAVPTFLLPLDRSAQAFARLATGDGVEARLREAAARIAAAMVRYPEMVAGADRFDTDLMHAAGGAILAKGGAEGFQGIALRDRGLGLAMKISDGNPRAIPPAALRVLGHLGALDRSQLDRLSSYREPEVRNHQDQLVGKVVPIFSFGGAD